MYHIPKVKISEKLLADIPLIPLWGNIFSLIFKGCRIPATSASCEGEFNRIKTYWISKKLHSVRPDVFVEITLKYLKGKLPILSSDLQKAHDENRQKSNDELSSLNKCKICKKSVACRYAYSCLHCLDIVHKNGCTVKVEDRTLCKHCSRDKLAVRNAASARLETWGGLGESRITQAITKNCIACQEGNMPDPQGGHKCSICKTAVHALPGCSVLLEGEEEGYGDQRVCTACSLTHKHSNATDSNISKESTDVHNTESSLLIDSPELLDMGTQKSHTKKTVEYLSEERNKYRAQAKYHGKRADDVRDSIEWGRTSNSISVIRNGTSLGLAPQKVNGKTFVLKNTCAFDSLTYLTLFAAHDFPNIKQKVR